MLSVIVVTEPFEGRLSCNETAEGRLNNAVGTTRIYQRYAMKVIKGKKGKVVLGLN
jgi:hypothetical protein